VTTTKSQTAMKRQVLPSDASRLSRYSHLIIIIYIHQCSYIFPSQAPKQAPQTTTATPLPSSLLEAAPVNVVPLYPVVLALPLVVAKPPMLTIAPPSPLVVAATKLLIASVEPPTTTLWPPLCRLTTVPEMVMAGPPATRVCDAMRYSLVPSTTSALPEVASE
jgi:hypothetical protein